MEIKQIDSKTLKKWLENNEAMLIDVREASENENSRIKGSKLIPLAQICCEKLPEIKNKKLVIHCQMGGRSAKACQKLLTQDSEIEVYNLAGGISDWIKQGFDIEKSKKNCLPINQQTQLTIGIGVLLGVALGYLVNPKFFLLSGFFGAGLIFAGLSGTCTLATLLTKMPWNK